VVSYADYKFANPAVSKKMSREIRQENSVPA